MDPTTPSSQLNLFQIWEALGRKTPFAAIREHWKPGFYVVVERIECEKMPYGDAFGVAAFNGRYSDRLEYDSKWEKTGLIPCCGCYQWTHLPDADLSISKPLYTGRPVTDERIKTRSSTLRFGKFNGRTVGDIFEQQPTYLSWLIENVAPFVLDRSTIAAFEEGPFKFPAEVKALNERKLATLDD